MRQAYLSRIITYYDGKLRDFKNHYLVVENGRVVGITDKKQDNFVDYGDYLILPGFVDTHIHLAQIDARAKWCPDLIDWLEKYIFPAEMKFEDEEYARNAARRFFQELAKNGTTTAAVFSSPFKNATDIAFQEASEIGLRVIMGQVMMDMNVPEELKVSLYNAEKDVSELANKWHGYGNMLYYAVTPRFAVSCSMNLMKVLANIAKEKNLFIQTHISEQEKEIEEVLKLNPKFKNYTEVYHHAGLLGSRSILAHGVHLNDDELKILKREGVSISHCPSSNFFLHSGVMSIDAMKRHKLRVGFGSDIAAGPYFSMLEVARDASYSNPISPEEAFYYLTLGGAKSLSFDKITGSLEFNKSADFVVVSLENSENLDTRELLSSLIYLGDDRNIIATYASGKEIYKKEKI